MGHSGFIFNVHMLGVKVHICIKYEVSMFIKPVARRAVHRCQ